MSDQRLDAIQKADLCCGWLKIQNKEKMVQTVMLKVKGKNEKEHKKTGSIPKEHNIRNILTKAKVKTEL